MIHCFKISSAVLEMEPGMVNTTYECALLLIPLSYAVSRRHQCDHVGRLLTVLGNKLSYKNSPNTGLILGFLLNTIFN